MQMTTRLGMLTPSSNTALEPLTARMLADVPDVTAHFARFRVTEIALSDQALQQFDDSEILRAAELLAHAKVHSIAWNGTSAAWKGFEADERLCERITAATGIPACTAVLGFRNLFLRDGIRRVGLVTPYLADVQARIMANWQAAGFPCSAEAHLGLQDNYAFATVAPDRVAELVREVAAKGCDAVAIVCTNFRGTELAAGLEAELGLPVYDSIAVTLAESLATAAVPPTVVRGWGSVFDKAPLPVR
jgi:maleate isomerase